MNPMQGSPMMGNPMQMLQMLSMMGRGGQQGGMGAMPARPPQMGSQSYPQGGPQMGGLAQLFGGMGGMGAKPMGPRPKAGYYGAAKDMKQWDARNAMRQQQGNPMQMLQMLAMMKGMQNGR